MTLTHDDDESTVMVEARYIPVPIKLEPRETVNSMCLMIYRITSG